VKVLAVVIGLVVVLFVVAVAWPAPAWDASRARARGDWRSSLSAWLTPAFDFSVVDGACVDVRTHVFRPAPTCAVALPKTRAGTYRFLRLEYSGAEVVVQFAPAPEDTSGLPSHPITLKASSTTTTVVVPDAGGTLTLACAPPAPVCLVRGG
jgi:hypothetical protein